MSTVKIQSPRAEKIVLRGMLSRDKKVAGTLLAQVDETYFSSEQSLEVYDLIKKHTKDSGESPTFKLILQDPDLSGDSKTFLKESSAEAQLETVSDARKAVKILNKYRQRRGLYNIGATISEQLQRSKMDAEKVLDEVAVAVSATRAGKATTDSFYHFGRKNNTIGLIRNLLYGERRDTLIPTGIEPFDEMAGGLPRGGLFIIGASTGGGKSVSASALAINMANKGYKVLLVPLEMSADEMAARITANVTKTPLKKVIQQKWEPGEAEVVEKRMIKWMKKLKKRGGQYTIFKPPTDVSIDDVFASIATYDYDVCIIDYISLLKGVSGDDQWQALGAVARQAKINAETNNRVNVLLCQVSEEGKVRYARAITEHANNAWLWVASEESKETGITRITQAKARNSSTAPFYVKIDYAHMRMEGINPEDMNGDLGSVGGDLGDSGGNDDSVNTKGKRKKDAKKLVKKSKKERLVNLASDV